MNSPHEPASPSSSTPSSDTPPPDDTIDQLAGNNTAAFAPPTSTGSINTSLDNARSPTASQTKRRLPVGSSAVHGSRDSKARRRDDGAPGGKRGLGSGVSFSEGREGGRTKDELIDIEYMERLKVEFGDPFDEPTPQTSA